MLNTLNDNKMISEFNTGDLVKVKGHPRPMLPSNLLFRCIKHKLT